MNAQFRFTFNHLNLFSDIWNEFLNDNFLFYMHDE